MHLCPAYNRRLMSHTAYAPLPGANYVAFSCCHIIANKYRLSMLFALLPYVVEEEVLFGTRACDRRKNFMDMRGCYGRRNRARGRQRRDAFTPENRGIGIHTPPLQNRLQKPLYLADFQGVKASHLRLEFLGIRGSWFWRRIAFAKKNVTLSTPQIEK